MTPVQRNVLNLADSLSFYGRAERRDGMLLVTASVAYAVFNIVVILDAIVDDNGEFEAKLRAAAQHYERHRHPWSCWVCADLLPKRIARRQYDLFASMEMGCIAEPPGMELPAFPPLRHPLPKLQYRRVSDATTRADFSTLTVDCFHIPPAIASKTYETESAWDHPMRVWIGYDHGLPVTSAATMCSHGVLGIYSVGTRPGYRRKGYGEAIMRHAAAVARDEGAQGPLLLQSSPAGLDLYRGLGFKRTTTYAVFASHTMLR